MPGEPTDEHKNSVQAAASTTHSRFAGLGGRAVAILGLSGLAVAQPLLDLFGRNPEFFVAGSYDGAQIVAFALAITLVPPAVGIALVALGMAIHPAIGRAAFAAVVGVLSTVLALAVLRTLHLERDVLAFSAAAVLGLLLTLLVLRTRGGRLLAGYLSIANLAFLALFVFASPTAALVGGDGVPEGIGRVDIPALQGPVVTVVLDEVALTALLRGDGSLNADRFPNFARLAATSTWFRNASSPHHNTHRAVPALLTGRLSKGDVLPTYRDAPRNLMTLMGTSVPVHRYEVVTDLCPRTMCVPPPKQPLRQALEDATVVFGHRILPEGTRGSLPRIDQSWGQYSSDETFSDLVAELEQEEASWSGDTTVNRAYAKWRKLDRSERSAKSQAAVLRERIAAIDRTPALHMVHVALPHGPWVLDRHGHRAVSVPEPVEDPSDPAFEFSIRQQYQLHSMQLGMADQLVGELLDRLEAVGALDSALVVVTSDHGVSLTPPTFGRKLTDENREEMLRMPLFVKAPGQREGEQRDDAAQTIDVLPSIIDLLDISTNWSFDGHSLYDGSDAHTDPAVSTDVAPLLALAAAHAEELAGDDWIGLAGVGEHGGLVGRAVGELAIGPPSQYKVTFKSAVDLDGLLVEDDRLPLVLPGWVRAPSGDRARPPEMLVAVNGRLAGVIGGYRSDGRRWAFDAFVEDFYRRGDNDLAVYEVTTDASGDDVLCPVPK